MSKIPFSAYDFFGYLASGSIVLAAVDVVAGTGFLTREWGLADSALGVIAIYVTGHAVAHVSSVVLEHLVVRKALGSPEEHLLSTSRPRVRSMLFPGLYKPLPAETIARISQRRTQQDAPQGPRAFFFHAHSLAKGHSVVQERLAVFLNLYGFARNVALALLVACGLLLYEWWSVSADQRDASTLLWWALVVLVAAAAMFYRYLKFFRAYTSEVFLTYAALDAGAGGGNS